MAAQDSNDSKQNEKVKPMKKMKKLKKRIACPRIRFVPSFVVSDKLDTTFMDKIWEKCLKEK